MSYRCKICGCTDPKEFDGGNRLCVECEEARHAAEDADREMYGDDAVYLEDYGNK